MRNRFDQQLEQLNVDMIEMGALCEQVIDKTYNVMMEEDKVAAREIMEKDVEIDHKEQEIESLCLKLLLQQQPVARDLRVISAALKMITDMERIGDQAADIAEIVRTTNLKAPTNDIPLGEMAVATIKMVKESIDAYVKKDLELARKVIEYDDVVDDLFVKTRARLIDAVHNEKEDDASAMDLLMIAKYYERIGDHATNVAEWVEFSITGEHRGEDK
ncbi:MAG: phosphate signaling complex protein PhoU [Lachnospiraceae bacterium]|nr:phosphate signaling complex protein PhoU [Lachnospiraceae bacterium]